jgi:hypothetical protein
VFAAEFLDAETFAVAVTSVFYGALSFLVGHDGKMVWLEKREVKKNQTETISRRVRWRRWPLVLW